jgi:hypothetical protein
VLGLNRDQHTCSPGSKNLLTGWRRDQAHWGSRQALWGGGGGGGGGGGCGLTGGGERGGDVLSPNEDKRGPPSAAAARNIGEEAGETESSDLPGGPVRLRPCALLAARTSAPLSCGYRAYGYTSYISAGYGSRWYSCGGRCQRRPILVRAPASRDARGRHVGRLAASASARVLDRFAPGQPVRSGNLGSRACVGDPAAAHSASLLSGYVAPATGALRPCVNPSPCKGET